ncbi:hypothetical protein GCM10027572_07730 [Flexivirga lutea]
MARLCDRTIVLQAAAAFEELPGEPGQSRSSTRRRTTRIAAALVTAGLLAGGGVTWALNRGREAHPAADHRPSGQSQAVSVPAVGAAATTPGAGRTSTPMTPTTQPVRTSKPAAAVGPVRTAIKYFSPFDTSGKPAVHVGSHGTGSCFTQSFVDPNAYRCITDQSALLDPCFASTFDASTLLCVNSPWDDAVQLTVNKPLPSGVGRSNRIRPRMGAGTG